MKKHEFKGNSKMPTGIPFIIGNEAAERLSYYGMISILTVYLADHLNLGDDTASIWVHYFGMGVYSFPMIGAIISDVFWGKYKTIITLSLIYCLGHLTLALFEGTTGGVIAGLTLIAIGAGGIKPCVGAHVGDQFDKTNSDLIERVYSYFYLAINFGGLIGIAICPILLKKYGASVAFGVPGILMAIATVVFWLGRNKFISIQPSRTKLFREIRSKEGIKSLLSVCSIYAFLAFFWALYEQTKTTFVLQAKNAFMDKSFDFFGLLNEPIQILPAQIQSINPLFILILTPAFTFILYPFLGRFFKVNPYRKIGFGFILGIIAFLIVGWTESYLHIGVERSIGWLILAYIVMTAAEVMVSITALELSYTQSPNTLKSIVMGLFLLSVSLGNGIAAFVQGSMTEKVVVEAVVKGKKSTIKLASLVDINEGDKLNLNNAGIASKGNPDNLKGTFVVGHIDHQNQTVQLLEVETRSPVDLSTTGDKEVTAYRYKLSGGNYFYFFSILLLAVTFVFAFASKFIKTKTYIQPLAK